MPPANPVVKYPPKDGIWRVARGDRPLEARLPEAETLLSSKQGNRFDDSEGIYGVLYFGTSLDVCFGEVLSRYRPSPELADLVKDEWERLHFMNVGAVPADWRQRRSALRVEVASDMPFLDVEESTTHDFLRPQLALGLAALGQDELDVAVVRGSDRRVTRLISRWTYSYSAADDGMPHFAGLHYRSRIDTSWECWAVFDDVELNVLETRPITLDMPQLCGIANKYDLRLH